MTLAVTLASRSPQRIALISRLGLDVTARPSAVAEEQISTPPDPPGIVQALALAKARDVAAVCPNAVVLGADTLVALDGIVLGKPPDAAAAAAMLRRLSGRRHEVLTGLAVLAPAQPAGRGSADATPATPFARPASRGANRLADALEAARRPFPDIAVELTDRQYALSLVARSSVVFHTLSEQVIQAYVASGEPMGKAGSYGIQGAGSQLIATLEGCFTNVVGLPLCAVAALLAVIAGQTITCPPEERCRVTGEATCLCPPH